MSDLIDRQDAIVQISKIIWDDAVAHDVKEVLKDLPSAQPEPCEDAVSREAVIAKLKDMRKHGDMIPWEGKRVFEAIRHLPSAQPETAKRIVGKSRDGMTLWYQCNMCNEPVDAQDDFCRGCGRRLTDG